MIYFGNLYSHNQVCQITAVCCILYGLRDGEMSMKTVFKTDFFWPHLHHYFICEIPLVKFYCFSSVIHVQTLHSSVDVQCVFC